MFNHLITNRDKSPESPLAELGSPSDSESARQPPMSGTPYKPYSETPALVRDCASLHSRIACRSQQMRTRRISKRLRCLRSGHPPGRSKTTQRQWHSGLCTTTSAECIFRRALLQRWELAFAITFRVSKNGVIFFPRAAQSARRLTRGLS